MLTQEKLRRIVLYNRETGLFTWVELPPHLARYIGTVAGTNRGDGYIRMHIEGRRYFVHRLAWLYEYGYYPKMIDHIDQNPSNNRIKNLRDASYIENMRNRKKSINNTSGLTGVVYNKRDNNWVAQMNIGDKHIYLGAFKTKELASERRKLANKLHGFTENHG